MKKSYTRVLNNKKQVVELDFDWNTLHLHCETGPNDFVDMELNEVAAKKLLKGVQKFLNHRNELRKNM